MIFFQSRARNVTAVLVLLLAGKAAVAEDAANRKEKATEIAALQISRWYNVMAMGSQCS